jgi:hypothetical protein
MKPDRERKEDTGSANRRTYPRVNIHPKVLAYPLRPQFSEKGFWGKVANLSQNGVCLETPEALSSTQWFLVEFQSPEEKKIQVPAQLVWRKDRLCGLEFLDSSGIEKLLDQAPR